MRALAALSWLFYDAAAGLVPAGLPLPDVFRGLAGNYLFVAGLTQFLAVRQVRRATVETQAEWRRTA